MKNQYFLKDKKARLVFKASEKVDETGGVKTFFKYYTPYELWCYTKQLSQEYLFYASMTGDVEVRLFVFNCIEGIKVNDYVLYRDKWYRIMRVDTIDDYQRETFIYAKRFSMSPPPFIKY